MWAHHDAASGPNLPQTAVERENISTDDPPLAASDTCGTLRFTVSGELCHPGATVRESQDAEKRIESEAR
jgi:hypothetical protein